MYQQQETLRKYAQAMEQMQRESQSDKQMLNDNAVIVEQFKAREEELGNQLENINYKLSETGMNKRLHAEELMILRSENENLQIDLKSLVNIEQALRTELNSSYQKLSSMDQYIQQFNPKINEMQQQLSESMNENENMKQDLMQFHKTIEMGSKENLGLKQEIHTLREDLLRKHQDNNQSATYLADKENEIFALKAELARAKVLLSTQGNNGGDPLSVDLLLKQNSDSFASDYLRNMHMKAQEDRNNMFSESSPANKSNKPNQFGYTSQSSYPVNQNFSSIQFALSDSNEAEKKGGPKNFKGLPSNQHY
jgi:chromosome segregation ATPase